MSFEAKEVVRAIDLGQIARKFTRFPRPVRGHDNGRVELHPGFSTLDRDNGALDAADQARCPPGLKNRRPCSLGSIQQEPVQNVPAERATKGCSLAFGHWRLHGAAGGKQRDAADFWAGLAAKLCADPELVKQVDIDGGREFAAHLAAWELTAFDDRDRSALPGQPDRSCSASRPRTDDYCIELGVHGAVARATKAWVKGPTRRSSRFHRGSLWP